MTIEILTLLAADGQPARSFAPEVATDRTGQFYGNGLRFATQQEAEANVRDLYSRWTQVHDTRVVPSSDPVNYSWINGQLVRVELNS